MFKDSRANNIDFPGPKKFDLLSFFCEFEIGMLINNFHYKSFSSAKLLNGSLKKKLITTTTKYKI